METNKYTRTIIKASERMVLTNKGNTLLATEICLGAYDSVDNYYEITEEEAQKIREENGKADYSWQPTTFELAKERKLQEIDNYYNSSNVNNFKLNGMDMWLDPTLRGNVQRQIWAANVKGDETLTISISGIELTLPIPTAEMLLAELEQYAATCYNVRDKKYAEVKALEDIEQVTAYDATSGYPVNPKFET